MRHELTLESIPATQSRVAVWAGITALVAAISVGAWVRIPLGFTPVPLSLQTLPVLLAPFMLGRRAATVGVLAYSFLGLAGAPVFTGPPGATLGYILIGFVLAVWVVPCFRTPAVGILMGTLAIYAGGAAWLMWYLNLSPIQAVLLGVVPFVPGDLLKALVAAKLVPYVRPAA